MPDAPKRRQEAPGTKPGPTPQGEPSAADLELLKAAGLTPPAAP